MSKLDPRKKKGSPEDETLFVLRDPERLYSHAEVVELLQKAEDMGLDLEATDRHHINNMTLRELDMLVNRPM